MQGLNEVSKYFNEELQCISRQIPLQDYNLHKIYLVLVKVYYQITINGITECQNTLCHMRKITEELKNNTFLNTYRHFIDHNWFCEPVILAPSNSTADNNIFNPVDKHLNSNCISRWPEVLWFGADVQTATT
jgi:hypothetical protein